ncbi:MAG: hypothetical protein WC269_03490 [Candidatus Gracilibacteria bacterium]
MENSLEVKSTGIRTIIPRIPYTRYILKSQNIGVVKIEKKGTLPARRKPTKGAKIIIPEKIPNSRLKEIRVLKIRKSGKISASGLMDKTQTKTYHPILAYIVNCI